MVLAITTIVAAFILVGAYGIHPYFGVLIETLMTYQILAVKSLKVESMKVYKRLKEEGLEGARKAVSMIVGRDTELLDEEGVAKAAVETVAENTSDGVIAPMLYTALGGPVLGFFYKALNTMDSMIGYKNDKYLYFGRTAAKLDDVVNYIPSRISAYLMILAAFLSGRNFNGKQAYKIYKRDRKTGKLMNRDYLKKLLRICKEKNIWVVLDECFIEFCGNEFSILPEIDTYDNLLLFVHLQRFMPSELGWDIWCAAIQAFRKIRQHLPEWNLSTFAQEAGIACVKQSSFIAKTVDYVRKERQFLLEHLNQLGVKTFPGEANFILLYSEKLLYEALLKQGILIRDCENFRGLSKGYYRIAVKTRKENEILLKAIAKVYCPSVV